MDSSFNLAVHALVCLSHSGRSLSSEALSENICTNPTRVRRVLAGLKKAGMVETRAITPAMPEQMAQSRSMSPLCHAQSTKRVFTASATCRRERVAGSAVRR